MGLAPSRQGWLTLADMLSHGSGEGAADGTCLCIWTE